MPKFREASRATASKGNGAFKPQRLAVDRVRQTQGAGMQQQAWRTGLYSLWRIKPVAQNGMAESLQVYAQLM